MKIISKIKSLLKARYRIVYQKENGDYDTYILQNPSWAKGRPPHFSNEYFRALGIYNKGFKAVCLNREGKGIRSFNYSGIRSVQKLSLFEVLA
jgi:hypothetical protein